jgi:hypothetical protein
MFTKKKKTSLPAVKRLAGQSLREEWSRLMEDSLPILVFGPLMLWFVVFVQFQQEWLHYRLPARAWLALAIISTGAAVIKFRQLMPQARNLKRGERGELKVAEALEDLRAEGYRIIHDIVRDGFNVDHVVVGPGGVFAIETKFKSGYGQIEFRNGEGLFVGGFPDENDCLKQARGNASEMNRLIRENCGMNRWVTPLVVFVGDWQIKNDWRTTDARVFTPDRLAAYFANQQPELMPREIELIASHLERSAKVGSPSSSSK